MGGPEDVGPLAAVEVGVVAVFGVLVEGVEVVLDLEAEAEERRGAVLRLSLWPDGPVDEVLAVASFHGQWIEWQAAV